MFLSVQKLLVWYSSTCLVLFLLPLLFDVISRKPSPGLMTRSSQPVFSVRDCMVSGFKSSVHSESVLYFTRCLPACVFTSLCLYLLSLSLGIGCVPLFLMSSENTFRVSFRVANSVFACLFLCFEGFFPSGSDILWFAIIFFLHFGNMKLLRSGFHFRSSEAHFKCCFLGNRLKICLFWDFFLFPLCYLADLPCWVAGFFLSIPFGIA